MVAWAVNLMGEVFTACWQWFSSIMEKIDGFGFIVAAILIVFITSLFLMPLRGGSVAVGGLSDITMGTGRYNQKGITDRINHTGKFKPKVKKNYSARGKKNE